MYFIHLEHKCQTDDTEIELGVEVSSHRYLALDGVLAPILGCNPKQPDSLGKDIVSGRPRHRRGCHRLQRAVPSNLGMAGPPRKHFSQLYFKLILKQCNSTPLIILVYTCHLQSCC